MKLNPFSKTISKEDFIKDWTEKKPLPMGRKDFEIWSDRIIKAAMVDASPRSQKFALADMITHLGATEDHKEDAYFIKVLRKTAVNQVAVDVRKEIYDEKNGEAEDSARLDSMNPPKRIKSPSKPGFYDNGQYFDRPPEASSGPKVPEETPS